MSKNNDPAWLIATKVATAFGVVLLVISVVTELAEIFDKPYSEVAVTAILVLVTVDGLSRWLD